MRQAYQQTFGIFDYIGQAQIESTRVDPSQSRPFASMELHPGEDTYSVSGTMEFLRVFARSGVGKYFNLSLTEILDYPHHIVREMVKIAEEMRKKEEPVVEAVEKALSEGT